MLALQSAMRVLVLAASLGCNLNLTPWQQLKHVRAACLGQGRFARLSPE